MKRQRIVIAVRIDERDRFELLRLAESNGLSESAIARLAIRNFICRPQLATRLVAPHSEDDPTNRNVEK